MAGGAVLRKLVDDAKLVEELEGQRVLGGGAAGIAAAASLLAQSLAVGICPREALQHSTPLKGFLNK